MTDLAFLGKYYIEGELVCKTGLHIGGSEQGFEIGGLDNPVIKDPLSGYPYIPGSSLKGKMRSLLEWALQRVTISDKGSPACICGDCDVCYIFGSPGDSKKGEPTRLTVYDSFPTQQTISQWERVLGTGIYTEIKTENSINRITSKANPRSMERVPAESVFKLEMIFDVYRKEDNKLLQKVFKAMRLLQDSYLGGQGTRGSGRVKFIQIRYCWRGLDYYAGKVEADMMEWKEVAI
jgi:CRISPR-associated protein Csm3